GLSKSDWKQLGFLDRQHRLSEEMAYLRPLRPQIEACRNSQGSSTGQLPPAPIVGTWKWTLRSNNCTEAYTFRPDGSLTIVSGSGTDTTGQTSTIYVLFTRTGDQMAQCFSPTNATDCIGPLTRTGP